MRMGQTGLLFFVLVAAGSVGFLAGRSTAPEPEIGPDPVEAAAPQRPAPPPTNFATGSLGEALAAIPVESAERGDGEITGVVKTRDGTPVSGARIIAIRQRTNRSTHRAPGEVPPEPDLEEQVVELVRRHHFRRSTRVEARTGSDGTFRLTGIGDGRYGVRAYSTGYRIQAKKWIAKAGATFEFTARLVASLEVKVFSADGTAAHHARVLVGSGKSTSQWYTSEDGVCRIEIAPGDYTLTASSTSGDAKSDPVKVKVAGAAGPFELHLRSSPGIKGRVIFSEGAGGDNPWIYVMRWSKSEDPDPDDVRRRGQSKVAWNNEGGKFVFADLAPGKWYLALFYNDRFVDSARVEVVDAMVEKDLTVPAPDPGDFLVVTVLGPDGKPVSEPSFTVGLRHANGNSSRGGGARSLGEGRFRVRHHVDEDEEEREEEEFYVEVRVNDLGKKTIVYDPETTRELTVKFETPAALTVRVPNAAEGELGESLGLHLQSAKDARGRSTSYSAKVEDGNTATFAAVSPGEYELRLTLRVEEHFGNVRLVTKPITLVSGPNEESVGVPPLYETTIVMPKDLEKQKVEIGPARRSDGHWTLRVTPKDGQIRLPPLPAGRYRVMPSKGMMSGMMEFSLPGPAVIQYTATPLNALRVSIRDPQGALAKAGFRDGDLIVGARGKVFENLGQLSGAIMGGGKEVPLLIDRGGRRVTVKINIQALMGDNGNHGGSMDPASRAE